MFSHSLVVAPYLSFFLLSAITSAAPRQDNPNYPWPGIVSSRINPQPWSGLFKVSHQAQQKAPITLSTENSTDCNEFPDPGYGGSDPPLYKFWPEATKIQVACWADVKVAKATSTYLRTTTGCYVNENDVQVGNKDLTRLLPECAKLKPYQVWTTKNDYLLKKDGFAMNCYKDPKLEAESVEVQWGARHVLCSVQGEEVGARNNTVWWRDAHNPHSAVDSSGKMKAETKEEEKGHCYIPDDAFDNMVFGMQGAGTKCADGV